MWKSWPTLNLGWGILPGMVNKPRTYPKPKGIMCAIIQICVNVNWPKNWVINPPQGSIHKLQYEDTDFIHIPICG